MTVPISDLAFFRGKRVFITGHTGFKGSWLCTVLALADAEVSGFALPPAGAENLYTLAEVSKKIHSTLGDIRDYAALKAAFDRSRPEIVFHLAAQPIVRESYRDPVGTYHTNVMGTVHLLECVRQSDCVRSVLNVTTDKVYQNNQWPWGYRESDRLNGYDPYSNSKSCSELVTESYRNSFFSDGTVAISTARAGNVIGGGDFSADRIIPDCIRAVRSGAPIAIRNPSAIRPYQHVLEPLSAYLLIARRQWEDGGLAGCYNVGPESGGCISAGHLADLFCQAWGNSACWEHVGDCGPHEDAALKLECSKIRERLGWQPHWQIEQAIRETVMWTKAWLAGEKMADWTQRQVEMFYI